MYIYIYIDDIRINMSVFNAAKHSIIATHIANKRNDVHCFVFEHIITISYLVTRETSYATRKDLFLASLKFWMCTNYIQFNEP